MSVEYPINDPTTRTRSGWPIRPQPTIDIDPDQVKGETLTPAALQALQDVLNQLAQTPDRVVTFKVEGMGNWRRRSEDHEGSMIVAQGAGSFTVSRLPKSPTKSARTRAVLALVQQTWMAMATPDEIGIRHLAHRDQQTKELKARHERAERARDIIANALSATYANGLNLPPVGLHEMTDQERYAWRMVVHTMTNGHLRAHLLNVPIEPPTRPEGSA